MILAGTLLPVRTRSDMSNAARYL